MLDAMQINSLRKAARSAVECEIETGIPAEMIISQWALESNWGEIGPMNNCFSIREYPGCSGRQLAILVEQMTDNEAADWVKAKKGRTFTILDPTPRGRLARKTYRVQDWLATFNTLTDCFVVRANVMKRGIYKDIYDTYMEEKGLSDFVIQVCTKWSSDKQYANMILRTMSSDEVRAALKEAKTGSR